MWQVVWIARDFDNDVERTASHLAIPPAWVAAALAYAEAYPDEIDHTIAANEQAADTLHLRLPGLTVFEVPDGDAAALG